MVCTFPATWKTRFHLINEVLQINDVLSSMLVKLSPRLGSYLPHDSVDNYFLLAACRENGANRSHQKRRSGEKTVDEICVLISISLHRETCFLCM